ncbi:hypothetical protein C7266_21420 [Klebsiella variicola]|nr:hypothetical protein [Klebsiella variicola]
MSVPLFSTRPFTPVIWTVFALYSNLDLAAPFSRTKDLSRDFTARLVTKRTDKDWASLGWFQTSRFSVIIAASTYTGAQRKDSGFLK